MAKALVLVVLVVSTRASADVREYLAADASIGYATSDFEDYTPALGLDVGAGGRITDYVGVGIRVAGFLRDEQQVWFVGPSVQGRVKDTSFELAVGNASLRERQAYLASTMPERLAVKMQTDGGMGIHVRIAQRVSHGLELSAELMTAEMERFDIDYYYTERHTIVSAGIGYRFF